MPKTTLADTDFTDGVIDILSILVKAGMTASKSEARRAVEQGGVTVDGVKVTDINPKTKQMILKTALSHLQVRCLEHNVERKKCYHSLG